MENIGFTNETKVFLLMLSNANDSHIKSAASSNEKWKEIISLA